MGSLRRVCLADAERVAVIQGAILEAPHDRRVLLGLKVLQPPARRNHLDLLLLVGSVGGLKQNAIGIFN